MLISALTPCKQGGCTGTKKPGKSHGFTGHVGKSGGAKGIRTPDPYVANVMLYQLSYSPVSENEINLHRFGDKANCFVEFCQICQILEFCVIKV